MTNTFIHTTCKQEKQHMISFIHSLMSLHLWISNLQLWQDNSWNMPSIIPFRFVFTSMSLIIWWAVNNIFSALCHGLPSQRHMPAPPSPPQYWSSFSLSPAYSPDGKILIHPQLCQCMCTYNMLMCTHWHQSPSIQIVSKSCIKKNGKHIYLKNNWDIKSSRKHCVLL